MPTPGRILIPIRNDCLEVRDDDETGDWAVVVNVNVNLLQSSCLFRMLVRVLTTTTLRRLFLLVYQLPLDCMYVSMLMRVVFGDLFFVLFCFVLFCFVLFSTAVA